jgi:hypothetical protein
MKGDIKVLNSNILYYLFLFFFEDIKKKDALNLLNLDKSLLMLCEDFEDRSLTDNEHLEAFSAILKITNKEPTWFGNLDENFVNFKTTGAKYILEHFKIKLIDEQTNKIVKLEDIPLNKKVKRYIFNNKQADLILIFGN